MLVTLSATPSPVEYFGLGWTREGHCPNLSLGIAATLRPMGLPTLVRLGSGSVWLTPAQQCRTLLVREAMALSSLLRSAALDSLHVSTPPLAATPILCTTVSRSGDGRYAFGGCGVKNRPIEYVVGDDQIRLQPSGATLAELRAQAPIYWENMPEPIDDPREFAVVAGTYQDFVQEP